MEEIKVCNVVLPLTKEEAEALEIAILDCCEYSENACSVSLRNAYVKLCLVAGFKNKEHDYFHIS